MKISQILSSWLIVAGLLSSPYVFSDEEYEEHEEARHSTETAMSTNPVYQNECGSCHMAYPPGLLPENAWRKLMSGLDNHFGDNAELDATSRQAITAFLVNNSADQSNTGRSKRFAASGKGDAIPLRISALPYFKREHREIPARLVTGNKDVLSFSNCNACHKKAAQGSFRERDIHIPGHGRWDD